MTQSPIEQAIESLEYAYDIYGDEDGPWPHIEQALTALRQHQQDGGWLPIESAPIEQWVLAAIDQVDKEGCETGIKIVARVFVDSINDDGQILCIPDWGGDCFPTHWQPLPPAPKKENDDGI